MKAKPYYGMTIAVLGAALWWASGVGIGSRPEPTKVEVETGSEAGISSSPQTFQKPAPAPVSSSLDKTLILNCIQKSETFGGQSKAQDFTTLDQFLKRTRGGESPIRKLNVMNIHGISSSGEALRLHVSQSDAADKLKVQVFGVDKEGLPTPHALPSGYEELNTEKSIERFRSDNQVEFTETQESLRWLNGESAQVTSKNGQTTELQIFLSDGRSLACNETNCSCLKP